MAQNKTEWFSCLQYFRGLFLIATAPTPSKHLTLKSRVVIVNPDPVGPGTFFLPFLELFVKDQNPDKNKFLIFFALIVQKIQ